MTDELVIGEDVLGALESAFDKSAPEVWEKIGDEAARASMREDLRAVGLVGAIAALAQEAPLDEAVRDEAPAAVEAELGKALGEGAPPGIAARVRDYAEKKASRGRELARKLAGRTLFDLYDLTSHGLFPEDFLRACDVIARARAGRDARELAIGIARLSNRAAQTVLGHIPDQLVLIHKLRVEEALPSEVEAAIREYAPRIYAGRIFSILKMLVDKEPRLRLAIVMWGRFRGLALGRDRISKALQPVAPEKPVTFLHALADPEARARLRALAEAERGPHAARAREVEDVLAEA